MGDRTYVTLTVQKEHWDAVNELDPGEGATAETDTLVCIGYEEVNYGELYFLPELIKQGIAYDSSWANGDEYPEGEESTRFTSEGRLVTKSFGPTSGTVDITDLVKLLDTPEELKTFILKAKEKEEVLGWEDQIANGKIYRARQLILQGEA